MNARRIPISSKYEDTSSKSYRVAIQGEVRGSTLSQRKGGK